MVCLGFESGVGWNTGHVSATTVREWASGAALQDQSWAQAMVLQKDATIQQLQEQKDRLEFAFEVGAWALCAGARHCLAVNHCQPASCSSTCSGWQQVLQWGADCDGWLSNRIW